MPPNLAASAAVWFHINLHPNGEQNWKSCRSLHMQINAHGFRARHTNQQQQQQQQSSRRPVCVCACVGIVFCRQQTKNEILRFRLRSGGGGGGEIKLVGLDESSDLLALRALPARNESGLAAA